jgi:transcriptional regulator with XRE-family HTH domain
MQTFNKEEFSRLLALAKGDRSINNFALKSGVTAAHISRLLRGMVGNPPIPQTLKKIADNAHNNVSYEELMRAAGHSSENSNDNITITLDVREKLNKWEQVIEMFEENEVKPEDVMVLKEFIIRIKN